MIDIPPDSWDEADYLRRYPDIAQAVVNRQFASGYHHYSRFGQYEARLPGQPPLIIERGRHTYGPDPVIVGSALLGAGSRFGSFCSLGENIEYIFRGAHMVDWVSTYPFRPRWQMDVPLNDLPPHSPIVVGNDVWIATNVKIKQGVTIGDGAVIATEAFVTKDVPPYAIVGGNPARIIRMRFTRERIDALLELAWWSWSDEVIKPLVPLMMSSDIDAFIKAAVESRRD